MNGDIQTADDAKTARDKSGADGVMVGRGANGKPWALRQMMDGTQPPPKSEIKSVMSEHYDMLLTHYGVEKGMKIARKHMGWYLQDCEDVDSMRTIIISEQNPDIVQKSIENLCA